MSDVCCSALTLYKASPIFQSFQHAQRKAQDLHPLLLPCSNLQLTPEIEPRSPHKTWVKCIRFNLFKNKAKGGTFKSKGKFSDVWIVTCSSSIWDCLCRMWLSASCVFATSPPSQSFKATNTASVKANPQNTTEATWKQMNQYTRLKRTNSSSSHRLHRNGSRTGQSCSCMDYTNIHGLEELSALARQLPQIVSVGCKSCFYNDTLTSFWKVYACCKRKLSHNVFSGALSH